MNKKIVMLNDRFDEEINAFVWYKGDVYVVDTTHSGYYIVKEINDIPYGVYKDLVNIEFEYI